MFIGYIYFKNFIFQGPSLLAYNNAVFEKDDWRGIRMIHDSIKIKEPMKVGKFGLGFKSVFHLTGNYTHIYTLHTHTNIIII